MGPRDPGGPGSPVTTVVVPGSPGSPFSPFWTLKPRDCPESNKNKNNQFIFAFLRLSAMHTWRRNNSPRLGKLMRYPTHLGLRLNLEARDLQFPLVCRGARGVRVAREVPVDLLRFRCPELSPRQELFDFSFKSKQKMGFFNLNHEKESVSCASYNLQGVHCMYRLEVEGLI